ncbi:DBH-like monooxygenase protein 1 isoform X1 [Palaemon carinicauda]|uniref:DBH-like monooxygenase protein 1 isoform X1 n=1 Tax=Palaemon carinicauda TaxID=392227 RepID=UPI0035B601F0
METLKTLWLLLTIAVGIDSQSIRSAPLTPMDMMHQVTLDHMGNFVLKWTPRTEDIVFEVHVATTGYVGFGFSPNGGMTGSDVIIGGVDDATSEVYLKDRFATGYVVPKVDEVQDVQLLEGYQNGTHTSLRFSRPWNTCDEEEDLKLSKEDTVKIIWSYGTSDPVDGNPMAISKHIERGTKSLYLNEPRLQLPEFGSDVQTWDLRSPNVQLPGDLKTLYWCKLFKIPDLPRKTHVIGYVPIISDDNIQHVHHILLYECHIPESERYFEKWIGVDGAQCFGANMPVSWKYCTTPIIAWAIGGEGSFTPDHVGFPLGEEHGGSTYFMMEMHYDNPNLRKGVVDNSGLRIFHTEKLRPNDAGILMLGHDISPIQIVPPRQKWMTTGICSSDCTEQTLPANGINVFAGFLHAHLLGRNMTLRHIRDRKELPVIQKDLNYDFNFQETRKLRKELTIYPGDSIIAECGLDSTARSVPTFGGFGTEEEMCLGFLYYYPRTDLTFCSSRPSRSNLFKTLGIKEIYPQHQPKGGTQNAYGIDEEAESRLAEGLKSGNIDSGLRKLDLAQIFRFITIKAPAEYENQTLYDILTSEDTWNDEALVQRFQDAVINGDHAQQCEMKTDSRGQSGKEEIIITFPDFQPLPPPADKCTANNEIGVWRPLACPTQLPSCNRYQWFNRILGNRPSFF